MTDLDARYGRARRPRPTRGSRDEGRPGVGGPLGGSSASGPSIGRWPVIIAIVLTVGVIAFWWLANTFGGVAAQSIRADTLRFSVDGDRAITLEFQLTAPARTELACAVEARDERDAVVGWDVIAVPASDETSRAIEHRVLTVSQATVVLAKECWAVDAA